MAKDTSKRPMSADRAAALQAAMRKIAASGLKQRFARENATAAYEAEKAMDSGDFARPRTTRKEDVRFSHEDYDSSEASYYSGDSRSTRDNPNSPERVKRLRGLPLIAGYKRDVFLGNDIAERLEELTKVLTTDDFKSDSRRWLQVAVGELHRPDEDEYAFKGPIFTGSLRTTGDSESFLRIKIEGDAVLAVKPGNSKALSFVTYERLAEHYKALSECYTLNPRDDENAYAKFYTVKETEKKERQ